MCVCGRGGHLIILDSFSSMTSSTRKSLQHQEGVLEQMVCRPQRPDLNITGSVWDYMKRQTQLRQPKSTDNLWQVPPRCETASETRGVADVLKAKGWWQ